jgi:hypothetical protein
MLKEPQAELMKAFIQNGDMPITKYWYFNDVYSDADKKQKEVKEVISKAQIDSYRAVKETKRKNNQYSDRYNQQLMTKYSENIKKKSMAVIGTQIPWLEAIALDAGASN